LVRVTDEAATKKTEAALKVADARFLAAGQRLSDLPPTGAVEIAFAGRSNVGKSSLLNSLMMRRSLVRTSKTPGATRTINLFEAKLATGERFVFADLPGYGYAQRSRAERASWGPMLEGFLEKRSELAAIVILVDLRRGLEDDDIALAEFCSELNRPLEVILCATKVDKIPLSKRKPALLRLGKSLSSAHAAAGKILGYSAITHDGREALWRRLRACATPEASAR